MLISLSYYPPGCQHYRKSVFEKNNMISIYFKILKFLHTYQWSNHIVLPTEATGEIPPQNKNKYTSPYIVRRLMYVQYGQLKSSRES